MRASPSPPRASRRPSGSPSSRSPIPAGRWAAPGRGEQGDASFIFVEGDVSLQRAGRSTFEPARQRQPLFDGDFVKAGKTGSAEIMFFDGTLYTIRPGSLFECRPAGLLGGAGKPDQDRVGRGQRLHVQLASDRRHRRGDGGDRPRLARVGRRRARRQDRSHELPRPDRPCRPARRPWSSRGGKRWRAAADAAPFSPKVALPDSPAAARARGQPDLRPEDRRPGRPAVDARSRRRSATASRSPARGCSSPTRPRSTSTTASSRRPASRSPKEGSYFWRVAAIDADGPDLRLELRPALQDDARARMPVRHGRHDSARAHRVRRPSRWETSS